MNTKTYFPKSDEIKRAWHLIDGNGQVLGRLATKVANILRGKDKAMFSRDIDCGDFVVITNASKIVLTGKKLEQKFNFRHSGYPGGDVLTPYSKLMADNPERAVELAVKGMLPKNKLADKQIRRLKVYKTGEHPHGAQFTVKTVAAEEKK